VRLYEASDWSLKTLVKSCASFCASTTGNRFAGYSRGENAVIVYSLEDGKEVSRIPMDEKVKIVALGFDAAGETLAVLFDGEKDDSETKVSSSDVPKELRGLDRDRFVQENDGEISQLKVYEAKSGAAKWELSTFYSTSGSTILGFRKDAVVVVNFSNDNAIIQADGTVELFEMPSSFNYGMGFSPDQKLLMGGGLAHGSFRNMEDGTTLEYKTSRLPGWPEYFKGFCSGPDGAVYGTTTGYRLIKVSPAGQILSETPVH
jgi:WD40 repeat protein